MITRKKILNLRKFAQKVVFFSTSLKGVHFSVVKSNEAAKIEIGDFGELIRVFSDGDVKSFATCSLDNNLIHLDTEVASRSRFGSPIVHGMLTASMFSAIFGQHFEGAVYLNQNLKFRAPVYIGERIRGRCEVIAISSAKKIVTCKTECINDKVVIVVTGEAAVLIPNLTKKTTLTKKSIPVDSVASFDVLVNEFAEEAARIDAKLLLLVSGEKVEKSGSRQSWCFDCVKAESVIEQQLQKLEKNVLLVECPVEKLSYKGLVYSDDGSLKVTDSKHPYRTHTLLKLTAIPTLYIWNTSAMKVKSAAAPSRLVEQDCYNEQKLTAFLQQI
jgi:3-hydroxybutyryl-CoA dehydratase